MASIDMLKRKLKSLLLSYAHENIEKMIEESNTNGDSYETFLEKLLQCELNFREKKKIDIAFKRASFPLISTFKDINIDEMKSMSKKELNQLKELTWVEKGFNLIFLGPPGAGKTLISTALGVHAITNGYKVFFTTMSDLIRLLKTRDMLRTSQYKVKYILDCELVIIDDLMFMAMEKSEANLFFQLINSLYGQSSIIITSNKGPGDWGELIGEPAITTAILDRILHKCEIVNLKEESWRMNHRTSIFGNSQV
jgi:DNA replication protein DnaC